MSGPAAPPRLDPMLGRRPLTIDEWRFEQGGETAGTRLELTDATPYRFTDVALDYFTAERALLRAFLGPYSRDE